MQLGVTLSVFLNDLLNIQSFIYKSLQRQQMEMCNFFNIHSKYLLEMLILVI